LGARLGMSGDGWMAANQQLILCPACLGARLGVSGDGWMAGSLDTHLSDILIN